MYDEQGVSEAPFGGSVLVPGLCFKSSLKVEQRGLVWKELLTFSLPFGLLGWETYTQVFRIQGSMTTRAGDDSC